MTAPRVVVVDDPPGIVLVTGDGPLQRHFVVPGRHVQALRDALASAAQKLVKTEPVKARQRRWNGGRGDFKPQHSD